MSIYVIIYKGFVLGGSIVKYYKEEVHFLAGGAKPLGMLQLDSDTVIKQIPGDATSFSIGTYSTAGKKDGKKNSEVRARVCVRVRACVRACAREGGRGREREGEGERACVCVARRVMRGV